MAYAAPVVHAGLPDAPPDADDSASEASLGVEIAEVGTTEDVMDWKAVSADFFMRRWRMFTMSWREPNVGSNQVSAAPFAGPIVVAPERGALAAIGGTGTRHDAIRVYNSAGRRLCVIDPGASSSNLVTSGITAGCRIVSVRSDGVVELHTPLGERLRASFSLPGSAAATVDDSGPAPGATLMGSRRDGTVVMARVGQRGLAALIHKNEHVPAPAGDGSGDGMEERSVLRLVICGDLDCDAPGRRCVSVDDVLLDGRPPACMEVLDRDGEAAVDVVLATADTAQPALIVASEDGTDPVIAMSGAAELPSVVERLVLSPDGQALAALCGGQVLVMSSALDATLLSLDLDDLLATVAADGVISPPAGPGGRTPPPSGLAWLGEQDGVALRWDRWGVLVVGKDGAPCAWPYAQPVSLLSEPDGLRVLSPGHHDFLARVLDETRWARKDMLRPGARLVNAAELFEARDAAAMQTVQALRASGELDDAVEQCLTAAEEEQSPRIQQTLLSAALFAIRAGDQSDGAALREACRRIRCLNALRRPSAGVGLTAFQLELLTPAAAADRLAQQSSHDVALRVCQCLGLPTRRVLEHWAAGRVASASPADEEEVLSDIVGRLRHEPGVSFADIAAAAHAAGKPALAKSLLRREPRLRRRVPLLLQMREGEAALDTALKGSDMGLVSLTVAQLRERVADAGDVRFAGTGSGGEGGEEEDAGAVSALGVGGGGVGGGAASAGGEEEDGRAVFFRLLSTRPQALSVAAEHLEEDDPAMLRGLLEGTGRWLRAAQEALREANDEVTVRDRARKLGEAEAVLRRGIEAGDRSLEGLRSVVAAQVDLLAAQAKLEAELEAPRRFVGTPLAATLSELLRMEGDKSPRARALVGKFRMVEGHFLVLRVDALASARLFDELVALAGRSSPIGFVPFVRACLDASPPAVVQARKLCVKVDDPQERMALQCQCEDWDEAAKTAARIGTSDAAIRVLDAMGIRGQKSDARRKLEDLAASGR